MSLSGMVCLALFLGQAEAQVYLIAGTPAQSFGAEKAATDLARVSADGTVSIIRRLVTEDAGTSWISLSPEHRTVVVVSGAEKAASTFVVKALNMDSAGITANCRVNRSPRTSILGRWLVQTGGGNLSYVQAQSSGEKLNLVIGSLPLGAGSECAWHMEDPAILRGIVAHGASGVFDDGSFDGVELFLRESGDLYIKSYPREVEFGMSLPKWFLSKGIPTNLGLMLNNRDVAVVATGQSGHNIRYLLLRKSDSSWHEFSIGKGLLSGAPKVRGFGRYVSVIEMLEPRGRIPVSAGLVELRSEKTPNGSDKVHRLNYTEKIYPGELHVYDAQTMRDHLISTGQADSEVLLIEGDSLYYRVGNKLYQSQISGEGVSTPKMLADSPIVGDAHWAFIAR